MKPPITDVRVDEQRATVVLAWREGSTKAERFHEFADEVQAITDPVLLRLGGDGPQLVVVGVAMPLDGACLFAFNSEGRKQWTKDLSTDRQWPDCGLPRAWGCVFLIAANLDDEPGEELVVVATDIREYPTRISIIKPRAQAGEITKTFWHMGNLNGGVGVEPDYFGPGQPAIIAWGVNNQLDGFDDGLRYGEKQYAHWDFVPVVMILDPTQMDGLGPPRNNRLPDLHPATPHAYAFLDRPHDTTMKYVPDYQGVQRQKLDKKLRPEETAPISDVRRSTHDPVPGTDPWFEVSITDRAMLIVDRHLRLITAEPLSRELAGINTGYWQPYWHPIIQDGKYVGE